MTDPNILSVCVEFKALIRYSLMLNDPWLRRTNNFLHAAFYVLGENPCLNIYLEYLQCTFLQEYKEHPHNSWHCWLFAWHYCYLLSEKTSYNLVTVYEGHLYSLCKIYIWLSTSSTVTLHCSAIICRLLAATEKRRKGVFYHS